eukprot:scaffold104648_cov61-Phaeocystis_antarctica.AAC.7
MARGGAKAEGAGAAARCSGVGWSGGSATARGATSDVLAALYLPEGQPEQPVLQLESQPESQPESQLDPPSSSRDGRGGGGVRRGIGEESAGKKAWARLGEGEKHGGASRQTSRRNSKPWAEATAAADRARRRLRP